METPQSITRDLIQLAVGSLPESVTDEFLAVFEDAARDEHDWQRAKADPAGYLDQRGLRPKGGLTVHFDDQAMPLEPDFSMKETVWKCFWHCERDANGKIITCERVCIYFYAFEEGPGDPRSGVGGVMRAST